MYSQQTANVPTRLQKNSFKNNRRKPRLSRGKKSSVRTKAVSFGMALLFVVISLSTGVVAATVADTGLEVGFEPENQKSAGAYASDNALFEQYDDALCVKITFYGAQEVTVYSAPTTVGELLSKLSMSLTENDVTSVDLETEIANNMEVRIDRVEVKELVETTDVPYKSEKVENSSLPKGTTKVKQAGVNGVITTITEEKYVNGVLVSSEKKSEEQTVDPVDEIIEVGTYVEPAKTEPVKQETQKSNSSDKKNESNKSNTSESSKESDNSSSSNSNSGALNTALATQHTTKPVSIQGRQIPDAIGTGGVYIDASGNSHRYLYYIDCIATAYGYSAGSRTATGKSVGRGLMAVDPRLIPYHTKCYVTGSYGDMGVQVAEDCGNFRGNWIDLFLGDDATCRQFGKRSMRVYVLA